MGRVAKVVERIQRFSMVLAVTCASDGTLVKLLIRDGHKGDQLVRCGWMTSHLICYLVAVFNDWTFARRQSFPLVSGNN